MGMEEGGNEDEEGKEGVVMHGESLTAAFAVLGELALIHPSDLRVHIHTLLPRLVSVLVAAASSSSSSTSRGSSSHSDGSSSTDGRVNGSNHLSRGGGRGGGAYLNPSSSTITPSSSSSFSSLPSAFSPWRRKQVVLRALGQLCGATGVVNDVYLTYPSLLPALTAILQQQQHQHQQGGREIGREDGGQRELADVREEVLRVMGTLGALSPLLYNDLTAAATTAPSGREGKDIKNKGETQGRKGGVAAGGGRDGQAGMDGRMKENKEEEEGEEEKGGERLAALVPAEELYPEVALQALFRLLNDAPSSPHHAFILHTIMIVCRRLLTSSPPSPSSSAFASTGTAFRQIFDPILPSLPPPLTTCWRPSLTRLLVRGLADRANRPDISADLKTSILEHLALLFEWMRKGGRRGLSPLAFLLRNHLPFLLPFLHGLYRQQQDRRRFRVCLRLVFLLAAEEEEEENGGGEEEKQGGGKEGNEEVRRLVVAEVVPWLAATLRGEGGREDGKEGEAPYLRAYISKRRERSRSGSRNANRLEGEESREDGDGGGEEEEEEMEEDNDDNDSDDGEEEDEEEIEDDGGELDDLRWRMREVLMCVGRLGAMGLGFEGLSLLLPDIIELVREGGRKRSWPTRRLAAVLLVQLATTSQEGGEGGREGGREVVRLHVPALVAAFLSLLPPCSSQEDGYRDGPQQLQQQQQQQQQQRIGVSCLFHLLANLRLCSPPLILSIRQALLAAALPSSLLFAFDSLMKSILLSLPPSLPPFSPEFAPVEIPWAQGAGGATTKRRGQAAAGFLPMNASTLSSSGAVEGGGEGGKEEPARGPPPLGSVLKSNLATPAISYSSSFSSASALSPSHHFQINLPLLETTCRPPPPSPPPSPGAWSDWLRIFSLEVLRHSPSPFLRPCFPLAQVLPSLAPSLLNPAFYALWTALCPSYPYGDDGSQSSYPLLPSLEAALRSPSLPPSLLNTLLGLCEYMELREKPLPIDMRLLGREAGRAQAFAKCLKYKEREFHADPSPECVEALIEVYNQLGLKEAACGVLRAREGGREGGKEAGGLRPAWLEKIVQWEKALVLYETYGE